jgi:hypothetical protein
MSDVRQIDCYEKLVRLQLALCCPACKGDIQFVDKFQCGQLVLNAELMCATCGHVGVTRNAKHIFNNNPHYSIGPPGEELGQLSLVPCSIDIEPYIASGMWRYDGVRYWSDQSDAEWRFVTDALGVNVRLLRHSWAGIVEIEVNGTDLGVLDLYEENGSLEISVPIFLGPGNHSVAIRVTGNKHPSSSACQVHFCGCEELLLQTGAVTVFEQPAINRGNPYPDEWLRLLDQAGPDDLILDCGGGDRRIDDRRVVNFEYCAFELPNIFGDGHNIPFKSEVFDLILSQAVIEHLYNPFVAVKEMHRILKVGGTIYAESAFMQPLHAVPFHFFNTTRWGIEKLFEEFDVEEIREVGQLADTLSWIYSLTSLSEQGFSEQVSNLLDIARELDRSISPEELRKFASFVSIKAIKKNGI